MFREIFNLGLIGYFELSHDYLTLQWRHTSDVGSYFWYVWKEETSSYIMVPYQLYVWGGVIFKFTGGGAGGGKLVPPLWEDVLQKRLGKTSWGTSYRKISQFSRKIIN